MQTTSKSSGDLGVSNAQVVTGAAILTGVCINGVAADVVVTIYDNTAASGTKLFEWTWDVSSIGGLGFSQYIPLPDVKATTGLWTVVTGAGAIVILHYK